MNTPESSQKFCPGCSAALPPGAAESPCPACLMKLGMQSWSENPETSIDRLAVTKPPESFDYPAPPNPTNQSNQPAPVINTTPPPIVNPRQPQPPPAQQKVSYQNPAPPVKTPAAAGFPQQPIKQPLPMQVPPDSPGPLGGIGFFEAVVSFQSYKNMAYLLLSFPLGILYFVSMIVGVSVGLGTIVILIGVPILFGVFWLARGMGGFERGLAAAFLRTNVKRQIRPVGQDLLPHMQPQRSFADKVMSVFTEKKSWLTILYLFLKFPLGIVSFVASIVGIVVPLVFLFAPAIAMSDTLHINWNGWEIDSYWEAIVLPPVGIVMLFLSINAINGLAWLHAQLAKGCLGD